MQWFVVTLVVDVYVFVSVAIVNLDVLGMNFHFYRAGFFAFLLMK